MLTLKNIRKTFGSTVAVDALSLEIHPGEVFGFLGPNGAGKTTSISIAVGLLAPDSGEVDLARSGSPMNPEVRRKVGIAPQAIALYDELTARENLRLFATLYGLSTPEGRRRSDIVLEQVGLSDRAGERVKGYSGGMKRRINLAAAMIHDPPLILLDEPTAGVDPQSRNNILDLVRNLRSQGRTIVYTTHYMEEAQRLCDRVAVIDHGKLIALDTVEGLIARHGGNSVVHVQTTTGEQRIPTADPVKELSARLNDPAVLNVRIDRPDLESVFLNLTGRSLRD